MLEKEQERSGYRGEHVQNQGSEGDSRGLRESQLGSRRRPKAGGGQESGRSARATTWSLVHGAKELSPIPGATGASGAVLSRGATQYAVHFRKRTRLQRGEQTPRSGRGGRGLLGTRAGGSRAFSHVHGAWALGAEDAGRGRHSPLPSDCPVTLLKLQASISASLKWG